MTSPRFLISLGFGLLVSTATGTELLSYNNIDISVADDYACGSSATVRLDAANTDDFHRSRMDMQEVAKISKTYLWLECEQLDALQFDGYVDGELVYQANANKEDDWYLSEGLAEDAVQESTKDKEDKPNPEPEVATELDDKSHRYSSLESLQAQADAGELQAKLDLAKALLDLEGKPENFSVEKNLDQGTLILEQLAAQGNATAMHLLAQAYLKHVNQPVNQSLVSKVTGVAKQAGQSPREMASVLLTMKAAEQGDEQAVVAMDEAGRSGSSASYYSLGMMYMLDRQKKMPYRDGFLKKKLKVKRKLSGRGNVDMGLHFMQLAAQAGSVQAQSMLKDMEIDFQTGQQGSNQSPAAQAASTGQLQTTSQNLAAQNDALQSGIALSDMLATRQARSTTANNQGNSSKPATSSLAGSVASSSTGTGGQGQGSASGAKPGMPSAGARQSRTDKSRRSTIAPTDDTIMDSEMGEAVIID